MSEITFHNEPVGTHPRYILGIDEGPGITNMQKLILEGSDDDTINYILVLTRDGMTAPVELERADGEANLWAVYELLEDGSYGELVEEMELDENGHIVHSAAYVDGFDTDMVPGFVAGIH